MFFSECKDNKKILTNDTFQLFFSKKNPDEKHLSPGFLPK